MRYPIVEFLSGVVTALLYYKFGLSGMFLFYLLLVYVLIVIAFIDFKTRLIPNKVLIFLLTTGIVLNALFRVIPFREAFLGFLISGGTMYALAILGKLLFKKESMGMGDVKFSAVVGFFLGWKLTLAALYFGFVFALFFAGLSKIFSKPVPSGAVPMGPFLSLSLLIFLLWGNQFFRFYVSFFNG